MLFKDVVGNGDKTSPGQIEAIGLKVGVVVPGTVRKDWIHARLAGVFATPGVSFAGTVPTSQLEAFAYCPSDR